MIECQLELYMSKNENLVWELKVAHYKFAHFLEGARTRLSLGEALVVVAKLSIGI